MKKLFQKTKKATREDKMETVYENEIMKLQELLEQNLDLICLF